jgi:sulfur relay (sulfurtransferase) DsrF/TusC family protein
MVFMIKHTPHGSVEFKTAIVIFRAVYNSDKHCDLFVFFIGYALAVHR